MRHLLIYTWIAITALVMSSCTSKEHKGANEMLSHATTLLEENQWEEALTLLDSLHHAFPKEVELRRKAFELSKKIKDQMSLKDSAEIAPKLQLLEEEANKLYQDFTLIEAPYEMSDENILRYQGYDPSKNPASPFLDCYITYDGTLQMVAGLSASQEVGSVGICVSGSKAETYVMSDTIVYDGGRNYRYKYLSRYYERLTLSPEAAMRIGAFVQNLPHTEQICISFLLSNKNLGHSFQLNSTARRAIEASYQYARLLREMDEMDKRLYRHEQRKTLREMEMLKKTVADKSK